MDTELEHARALVVKAGMQSFQRVNSAYEATAHALFPVVKIAIDNIEPIVRGPGVHTFVEDRALAILSAIKFGILLPPVLVYSWSSAAYEYKLYDGFHRYYISLALGFSEIFVGVNPWKPENAATPGLDSGKGL